MASHPVCARITYDSIQNDQLTVSRPAWTAQSVELLLTRSVEFEKYITRLLGGRIPSWHIKLPPGTELDRKMLMNMVTWIGSPRDFEQIGVKADYLSRYCTGMWKLKIVPERYPLSWTETKSDDGEIIYCNGTLSPYAGAAIANVNNGAPMSPQSLKSGSSGSTGVDSARWCWEVPSPYLSPETAMPVANIALTLGLPWNEVFKRDIRTVVWNWPISTEAVSDDVAIPCLQHAAIRGYRKTELNAVRQCLLKFIDKKKLEGSRATKQLAKQIEGELKSHGIPIHKTADEAPRMDIYFELQNIQTCLLGPTRPTSTTTAENNHMSGDAESGSGASGQGQGRGQVLILPETTATQLALGPSPVKKDFGKPRSGSTIQPGALDGPAVVRKVLRRVRRKVTGKDDREKFVYAMLDAVDDFIASNQEALATKLLAERKREVDEWERELGVGPRRP